MSQQIVNNESNYGAQGIFHAPVTITQATASPPSQAEVLLITVTQGETRAVFDALQAQTGRQSLPRYQGDKTYYDLDVIGGARVWLVRSQMGAMTPGGAFATAYTAITAVRPSAIIMVGIAFGIDQAKQQIGDVLVARQLYSYEQQRVGTLPGGELIEIPRGDRATTSTRLLDRCEDGALSWPADQARVKFGLILSGEKLVDHAPTVAKLRAQEREAIGGEMEGSGLYVAATQHKIDWILIKAICDWADGHKAEDKEARQALAARNAAAFVLHVLARGGFAPEARVGA
jgi:nucleoside phosphorylase